MTKISQLSSIGDSLAVNDQFLIRDVDDATTPNKSVTVSGITRALDVGSATAPAIAFATDKNTGIYSPGADQVAISTNGSGRLFVDASGNVGLGISPTNRLHVYASGVSTPALIESTSTVARIAFKDSGTTDSNTVRLGSAGNDLSALAGGSERLRITSAGLVGIGTTSPTEALTVAGNASFTLSGTERFSIKSSTSPLIEYKVATNNYFLTLESAGTSQGAILFNTGTTAASERARIDSSGRLLVGTSSALTNIYTGATAATPQIQLSGAGLNESSLSLLRTGPTGATIFLNAGSSGNTVQSSSILGRFIFNGFDGTNYRTGGQIACEVDGTPGANDMPGRIVFATTSDGASSPTERLRIDSSGRVGIGTSSPTRNFVLNGTGVTYLKIAESGLGEAIGDGFDLMLDSSATAYVWNRENGAIAFGSNNLERARIDSSGRLLVGTSASRTVCGQTPQVQLEGLNVNQSTLGLSQNSNDANSSLIVFGKSRATTLGGSDIVAANDRLGGIRFSGGDGVNLTSIAASIETFVDGTPGANDMPGRIVLSTTADGASSPTERMRITSSGFVGIGTTNPTEALTVAGNASFTLSGTERFSIKSSTSPLIEYKLATSNYFLTLESVGTSQGAILFNTGTTAASERARIDSSGRLLVGTSSALTNIYTGATAATPQIQLSGAGLNESSLSLLRTGPTGATIFLNAGSSGNTVQSSSILGRFIFNGFDGTNYRTGGQIACEVDGTPGANDMPGRIVFSTTADGASSPTERLRITSTGQLRLAGAGITFNGDTATANELDDYEEGTWTPAFAFGTSGSVSYEAQLGEYVKVGNTVTARGLINLSAVSSPTGNTTITGLPFTSGNRAANISSGFIGIARSFASAGLPLAVYNLNNTSSVVITKNDTNSAQSNLQGSDLTATTIFYFTVIYAV